MFDALIEVCWAEGLKLRRSRAPKMTAVAYAMVPVAAALFMLAANNPAGAGIFGLMTLESRISLARADWPRYFSVLASAGAAGGLVVFGLFVIWIFAREHADHTSKELVTLPVPRALLAFGKILVAAGWCLALQCGMFLVALILGASLGLPLWSPGVLWAGLLKSFNVAALTFCLAMPFGLAANLSRGTMAAVGVLFLCLFFALVIAALGWGAYFPWSIPAMYGGTAGMDGAKLGDLSFYLVILTGLAGVLGSMAWWRWADQR